MMREGAMAVLAASVALALVGTPASTASGGSGVGDRRSFRIPKRWCRRSWNSGNRNSALTHEWFGVANASWPEFEAFAHQYSGQDLTGFFQAWAHGTTIPPKQYLYPGSLAPLAP